MTINMAGLKPRNDQEAARFLTRATLGYTRTDINTLKTDGYAKWFADQFAMTRPSAQWHWNWMKKYRPSPTADGKGNEKYDVVDSIWRRFIEGKDLLRQKTTFALSQIAVTSTETPLVAWQQFAAAHYIDVLESNAFGNYRALLEKISRTAMMGHYLTFIGSKAAGTGTGADSRPDENYARELLQLFAIGVARLDMKGSPLKQDGKEISTYVQDDIEKLAEVFTGWKEDKSLERPDIRSYGNRDLVNDPAYFDGDAKSFSPTFSAGIPGATGNVSLPAANANTMLVNAINLIFSHTNVAPFISKQLIQRFVTSNPDPLYVERVANVFKNTGGNMQEVLKAVLMDESLFEDVGTEELEIWVIKLNRPGDEHFGKLREPVARFVHLAKVFGFKSVSGGWYFGGNDGGSGDVRLGEQVPMRSQSVFNFFRPGHIPPSTEMSRAGLVAPEFQITNEASVVAYLNYMYEAIHEGVGTGKDIVPKYSTWTSQASNVDAMVKEMNVVLAGAQLSNDTVNLITNAVRSISASNKTNRVKAAAMLMVASPEFLVQK